MKMLFSLLLAFLLFTTCFSQRRYNSDNYDGYMAKSRRLSTAGWVLLGAGTGMLAGGIVLIVQGDNANNNNINNGYYNTNTLNSQQVAGVILVYGGVLCSLGSIPLLVIGHVMHKRAMQFSSYLDMQKVPDVKLTGIPLQPFPAIGVRINLLN